MKKAKTDNIFNKLPSAKKGEVFEKMISRKGVKIERITSLGQVTPPGRWMKSRRNEWVILLKGKAKLRFRGTGQILEMKPGNHVFIPAGTSHRVEWTAPSEKSVWVAVLF